MRQCERVLAHTDAVESRLLFGELDAMIFVNGCATVLFWYEQANECQLHEQGKVFTCIM